MTQPDALSAYREAASSPSSDVTYNSSFSSLSNSSSRQSTLAALPSELLEHIAFDLACLIPYDTPRDVLSLFLCSKEFHQSLAPKHNARLYARLFKDRFDTGAVQRRFSPLNSRELAAEFFKRIIVMSRLRGLTLQGRLYDGNAEDCRDTMISDLWTVYLMLLEHDTKNMEQLKRHALLKGYLDIHYRIYMLQGAMEPGYPAESMDRALAAHISYFMTSQTDLDEETAQTADERFFVLKPYVFAAHKYPAYFADWIARRLPSNNLSASGRRDSVQPFRLPYFGHQLTIRPPILFHAACLSFGLRADRDPEITGAAAITELLEQEARVATIVQDEPLTRQFNFTRMPDAVHDNAAHLLRALSAKTPQTPLPVLDSRAHDFDFQRLRSCSDPTSSKGLDVAALRGSLRGTWEGRFSFFDFDSYREMLNGRVRSLYEGPFRAQPQIWKIDELVVRLGESDVEGGTGPVLNGGLPNGGGPTFAGMRVGGDVLRFRDTQNSVFGQAPLDVVGDDEHLKEDERYEILLSGSGHSAWGQFVLHGRIRTWDGLFTLAKEYTPDGRGRWLYRGYAINGGQTLVGRWRDTFTPAEQFGYEGNFVMSKRDDVLSTE